MHGARRCLLGAGLALCVLELTAVLSASALAAEAPVTATSSTSVERLRVGESADIDIKVSIADGWHINGNEPGLEFLVPTTVDFELPAGLRVVDVRYPPPVVRRLKLGGSKELKLYEGSVPIKATVHYESSMQAAGEPVVVVRYQACNDTLCLKPAAIRLPLGLKLTSIDAVAAAGFNEEAADSIACLVAGGLWVVVPGMLLLGLALNLTPCVYPLLSVTIAYFGSQSHHRRGRKLGLAVTYTLGIALMFSALGASAALSGGLFGRALTNPWVLAGVAAVLVALALSCFGFYRVRVPAALGSKLGRATHGVAGALFMGMTMGVVAAPCVAPVVVGLLVFVGSRGDLLLGLGLFFLLALGLGIPYVALALAAGSIAKLPRSGAWLRWTEHLFGCILLAMAVYFVEPILRETLSRLLMPTFLILAILYLAFLDRAGRESRPFVLGRGIVGAAALVAIVFAYLPSAETQEMLPFEPFTVEAYDRARTAGKPFVVEFSADWCLPCKEMEERTFTDPHVVRAAHGFKFLSVDMTTTDRRKELLLQSFDVVGAPTTVFFGADGKERTRRVGFIGPQDFLGILSQVAGASGEFERPAARVPERGV